jgi:small subunit ribosomal protein S14e
MAPKGKKVERKEENISLGPQIREGSSLDGFFFYGGNFGDG